MSTALVVIPQNPPLTPPDCDLRGLPFMPLDGDRLLESDLFFESTGDEFKAAVALWWASWKQVPAASLPAKESVLAGLAKVDAKKWAKVREVSLHGWIKCSDGRLYHPVVAEKALEAWEERQHHQDTKAGEKLRKQREREDRKAIFADLKERGIHLPWNTPMAELRAMLESLGRRTKDEPVRVTGPDSPRTVTTIEGTGTGTEGSEDKSSAGFDVNDIERTVWFTGVNLLTEHGGMAEKSARAFIGKLISVNKLQPKELLPLIATAAVNQTRDPQAYLTKAAAGIAQRRDEKIPPQAVGFV